jgi:hypothetical protein
MFKESEKQGTFQNIIYYIPMKIDKNLFDLLTNESTAIFDKFSDFIKVFSGINKEDVVHSVKEDFIYTGEKIIKTNYNFRNYNSLAWNLTIPQISIYHVKGGNIDSFSVRFNGDIQIEEEIETKNIFGLINKKKQTTYERFMIDCYPFVSVKSEIFNYDKNPNLFNNSYIDFDEYIDKITKINFTNKIDIDTLRLLQKFINQLISDYKNKLRKIGGILDTEISIIDKNADGKADILDSSDLMKLLTINQSKIINIDKDFIHKIIRISNYLKQRDQNIQSIFSSLLKEESINNREELFGILKNQIHNYESLLFHSINMVVSISSNNLVAFYEIYETFDKLNVFNSNWENEVSDKLTNIGYKLDDLMYSIYNMEQNIVGELSNLTYVTQASFEELNRNVSQQLKEVESSINSNNLLTGIQAYQLYKIDKNIKGLSS